MTSEWPQLDELIRELSEVSALPSADGEASLTDATMAVTKATTALARAAHSRGRNSAAALTKALTTVEEARTLLRQARAAMNATARQRRARVAETAKSALVPGDGHVDAACPACRAPFVVRYRVVTAGPLVAFPVACPAADCDGVSEVLYPGSASDVVVEMLPGA